MSELFTFSQTSGARFSPCRRYRYELWRRWETGPYLQVIGLNPSTADETNNDPTVRRCIDFAKRWGFSALCMTNEIIAQVLDFINRRRPVPCGEATHMRDSPDDSGKARFCERPKGHTGKHSAHYCGKRRFWKNAGHDKSVHTAKPNPKPK